MELNYIEHIGIAVKNIEEATKYYEEVLGLKRYSVEEVPEQKVKTAFFRIGQTKIELLESTSPDGPIAKFIEKKGEGIHHIAFSVTQLQSHLNEALSKGVQLIDTEPRKGAEGMDIAFIHPRSTFGVLTELCESDKEHYVYGDEWTLY
jgi:methylmalonyl-CoA/ethylmalonyl-CoA epimerase